MLTRTDADHDPIDPDVATTPLVNVAADGRAIGNDGSINFSAISNAGRVMFGAREICRTSRREALNMLKFLQKINNSSNASTRPRRAAGQSRNGTGVVPSPQRSLCRKETKHTSARPLARQKKTQRNRMCKFAHTVRAVTKTRRVLKLGLISPSHLGYPRHINALVDFGAESSFVSPARAKELGVKVRPDETRLLLAQWRDRKGHRTMRLPGSPGAILRPTILHELPRTTEARLRSTTVHARDDRQ